MILYRKDDYRKFQFFVQPNWPGGIYATAAIGGKYRNPSKEETSRKYTSHVLYMKTHTDTPYLFLILGNPELRIV